MSLSALISVLIAFVSLILAFVLDGGSVMSLLKPTAALIVFGGTIGAVGISTPSNDLKRIPALFKIAFGNKKSNIDNLIDYFRDISVKTRKEGFLSIEGEINKNENLHPMVKKGLQLVVDGIDPEVVRNIMESEADSMYERHKSGAEIFDCAGGFAPTMGIIGTVMGLVHVLGNLSDPSSLGAKIATAFIATLYGVGSANLLWLPIANKLKALNRIENDENELIIEAVLAIQAGLNPNTLVEKLKSFLDKKQASKYQDESGKAAE